MIHETRTDDPHCPVCVDVFDTIDRQQAEFELQDRLQTAFDRRG